MTCPLAVIHKAICCRCRTHLLQRAATNPQKMVHPQTESKLSETRIPCKTSSLLFLLCRKLTACVTVKTVKLSRRDQDLIRSNLSIDQNMPRSVLPRTSNGSALYKTCIYLLRSTRREGRPAVRSLSERGCQFETGGSASSPTSRRIKQLFVTLGPAFHLNVQALLSTGRRVHKPGT